MSDSDTEVRQPKNKDKKKTKRELSSSGDEGVDDPTPIKKRTKIEEGESIQTVKNADGEEMIEIGKMKFASVRSFKGQTFVDIREFYADKGSGALKPGKKGISLNKDQYANLKKILGEIDKRLAKA